MVQKEKNFVPPYMAGRPATLTSFPRLNGVTRQVTLGKYYLVVVFGRVKLFMARVRLCFGHILVGTLTRGGIMILVGYAVIFIILAPFIGGLLGGIDAR
jgi:hypothetical protein